MASLPQIFAEPNVPAARAPSVPPEAFGTQFWAQVTHSFGRLAEAQQLLDVQKGLDARDQLYQQRRFDMQQDPQKYASMSMPDFIKQFNENANADDQAVLSQMPWMSRRHAEVAFARFRRHEMNQSFDQYHKLWMDQGQAQTITMTNDLVKKIAASTTDQEREFYRDTLNTNLTLAGRAGFFLQHQIATMRENVNSQIEQEQVQNVSLDKQSGGPDNALSMLLDRNQTPNIKPLERDRLIDTIVKTAEHNELQAERRQRATQESNYLKALGLAEDNKLSEDEIKQMRDLKEITPTHARSLMNESTHPTMAAPRSALDAIMYERGEHEITIQNNNATLNKLLQLPRETPGVIAAIEHLRNQNRILSHTPAAGNQMREMLHELDLTPVGAGKNLHDLYHRPGMGQTRKTQQYGNVREQAELDMMHNMPKEQVLKKARDALMPKVVPGAGKSSGQQLQEYLNGE